MAFLSALATWGPVILKCLPEIINAGQQLYMLWKKMNGTHEENDCVMQAMKLLSKYKYDDDLDKILQNPEKKRVLIKGLATLMSRINEHERRALGSRQEQDDDCGASNGACGTSGFSKGETCGFSSSSFCSSSSSSSSSLKGGSGTSCDVCRSSYNEAERRPLTMLCGHTFCRCCLRELSRRHNLLPCPVCREVDRRPLRDIPTNFALLDLLKMQEQKECTGSGISDEGCGGMTYEEQIAHAISLSMQDAGSQDQELITQCWQEVEDYDMQMAMAVQESLIYYASLHDTGSSDTAASGPSAPDLDSAGTVGEGDMMAGNHHMKANQDMVYGRDTCTSIGWGRERDAVYCREADPDAVYSGEVDPDAVCNGELCSDPAYSEVDPDAACSGETYPDEACSREMHPYIVYNGEVNTDAVHNREVQPDAAFSRESPSCSLPPTQPNDQDMEDAFLDLWEMQQQEIMKAQKLTGFAAREKQEYQNLLVNYGMKLELEDCKQESVKEKEEKAATNKLTMTGGWSGPEDCQMEEDETCGQGEGDECDKKWKKGQEYDKETLALLQDEEEMHFRMALRLSQLKDCEQESVEEKEEKAAMNKLTMTEGWSGPEDCQTEEDETCGQGEEDECEEKGKEGQEYDKETLALLQDEEEMHIRMALRLSLEEQKKDQK